MKRDIKTDIMLVARSLFYEQGYDRVSMRDIADKLNISVGNLTYHFNRKEDLIEAVVGEMHKNYCPPPVPETLEQLDALFSGMMGRLQENAYYFWNYTELSKMSESIRQIQRQVIRDIIGLLTQSFTKLRENGLMEAEDYAGQYMYMAQSVMMVCTYWLPHSKVTEGIFEQNNLRDCMWSAIFPKLTPSNKEKFLNKI